MNSVTQEQFEEQYGDMMLDGLDSYSTYIPLRTNKRLGINVAIRPYALRISEGVVLFGGKLRVGYTIENGELVKAKVEAINDEARMEQLKDFCKGWSWQKMGPDRFSTMVGIGFAASQYDGDMAREALVNDGVAIELLKRLEATYQQYNDASFKGIRKAASALHDAWVIQSQSTCVFTPIPQTVQLPEAVVGQQTGVLNQAQEKYTGNVLSFQDKVDQMKASFTKEETNNSSE